ncbi:hypothetical protein DRO60_06040 [Candidatus Bathyarchaeota archaeon]|nr:MAG: hypothetical protein DRO60_06040 [Candidatus Bathyarchaeota archaeon]
MPADWAELYEGLRAKLGLREKHIMDLRPERRELFIEATEALRERFVLRVVSRAELEEARAWIKELEACTERLGEFLGVSGISYTRELGSFLADPLAHLKKKIFIYTFDLLAGKLDMERFERKAAAAIRTSLRTNMRSIYQTWVFLKLLELLAAKGPSRLIYPEHGLLYVERSGRQRTGSIPPNCVVGCAGRGALSFFLEVPRPIAWEDGTDLARVWKFYVALRPDMMVYGGVVMDIAQPSADPPVRRPDFIVECKELSDWYERVRDLRGQLSRPLSAEEWRALWLKGLWDGLAAAMGVGKREVVRMLREERSVRLREPQLVRLYRSVYRPDRMVLVSRTPVPDEVREELEASGITVLDGVGFRGKKLEPLVEELLSAARAWRGSPDLLSQVADLLGLTRYDRRALEKAILGLVREHKDDLLARLQAKRE